jgi:hypothetical protein
MTTDATASLDEIDTAVANVTPRLTPDEQPTPSTGSDGTIQRRGT